MTHLWGYRNYETDEDSRNDIVLGRISNGEGWHNNHHADRGRPGRVGNRAGTQIAKTNPRKGE